jgi:hypothetical protein
MVRKQIYPLFAYKCDIVNISFDLFDNNAL